MPAAASPLDLDAAARLGCGEVFASVASSATGLSTAEAARRFAAHGPNELANRVAGPFGALLGQLKNPHVLLLASTAGVSIVLRSERDWFRP